MADGARCGRPWPRGGRRSLLRGEDPAPLRALCPFLRRADEALNIRQAIAHLGWQPLPRSGGQRQGALAPILKAQIAAEAKLMTDESGVYTKVGREFAEHGVVTHGIGEYVRGGVHTITIEGYFSIVKRGLNGVYHHVSPEHLKR